MRYLVADARRMPELPDASVHLVVTSPPYWALKDYGVAGQIGMGQAYEDYLASLDAVWRECHRALHPGCRVVINVGDQYLRAATYGRYRVLPIREAVVRQWDALGCDYMGAVIWRKVTTQNSTGGAAVMGSFPHPRNGILKLDYEFVLIFRKPGKPPKPTPEQKQTSLLTNQEWARYFAGHWEFPGERHGAHHAAFPLELPLRAIRMFTFPGETVLDPFAGTGTTLLAAAESGRDAVGYEIADTFVDVMREKLGPHAPDVERRDTPTRVAGDAPFYGSAVTLGQVGRPRDTLIRVSRVTGPTRFEAGDAAWELEGVLGDDPAPLRRMIEHKRVRIEASGDGRAYVWLANQTFVNARLVREGALRVDPSRSHPRAAVLLRASRSA
ncbi:MAG: DNA methyltransferase [Myxococcota bacterium]